MKNTNNETSITLVDIIENDDEVIVYADMPGVNKDSLSINIDNFILKIEGEIKNTQEQNKTLLTEFKVKRYERSFNLSKEIDVNNINAEINNGLLRLKIAKIDSFKPRKIIVNN